MQKKIIALAIAAAFAAPVAMAADGVTVYGALDGGLRSITSGGVTSNTMGSGTYNSNRWGIKSVEDLGDGMKANVTLEGDIVTGTGQTSTTANAPIFARTASVGLSGDFGAVDLGRVYSVSYKVNNDIDPFAHKFINITWANISSGANLGTGAANATRYDNDISYTGKFGDVKVMAEHSMGNSTTPAGADYGSVTAAGVAYASGPINLGASYSRIKSATTNPLPETTHMQVGAGFNFGEGSVKAGYSNQVLAAATSGGNETKATMLWLGGNFNVSSKVGVTAAYYKATTAVSGSPDGTGSNIVAAVTYSLSKRTLMYVEADKQTTNTGAVGAADVDSNGYSLGLSTTF